MRVRFIRIFFIILFFSVFLISCGDNGASSSNICEPNPCADSQVAHKTTCEPVGNTDFKCICTDGYEDYNGTCKWIEIDLCNPNPCKEENKTTCVTVGIGAPAYPECQCDNNYEEINGKCVEKVLPSGCNLPIYKEVFDSDLRDRFLMIKLHEITGRNYNELGYSAARNLMYNNVDNINNKNQCVYTGRLHSIKNGVNCEHTWPQGLFNQREPMRSDLHHLFPTEYDVNNERGSLPFGNIDGLPDNYYGECNESSPDYYCSKIGISSHARDVFEPADQHKGNVARAMFYFATRHGNIDNFLNMDMQRYLAEWNKLDPVDERDIERNNKVDSFQHNRNPYVDCPEFLDRIDLNNITFPRSY